MSSNEWTVYDERLVDRNPKNVMQALKLTIPPSLVDTIDANTLFHLFDFKTDQTGIGISIAVILNQERDSFLVPALGHQPSRRLGDEPNGENNDQTGEALADEWNTPLVVVADKVGSVCDRSCGNRTTIPTAVVETYSVIRRSSIAYFLHIRGVSDTHRQHDHASEEGQFPRHKQELRRP